MPLSRRTILTSIAFAVLCLITAGTANANTIVLQTNFQAPNAGVGTYAAGTNVGYPNTFYVAAGTVAVLGPSSPGDPCAVFYVYSGQCLSLSGGRIQSNLSFGPGLYELTLRLANVQQSGPPDLHLLGVQFGNTASFYQLGISTQPSTIVFYSLVAAGESAQLIIEDTDGLNITTYVLNSVTVNQVLTGGAQPVGAQPVPEPATMLLLGTGLAGVAAKVRNGRSSRS